MKSHLSLVIAALTALGGTALNASTISGYHSPGTEPNPGGIGYSFLVSLGASDSGSVQRHVGAWSWEDNALFGPGEDPVGWTHTSDWIAVMLSEPTTFTFRLERQAGVPWPGAANPDRLASIASMFPSFTIFSNWDNDPVPDEFKTRPEVIAAFASSGGVPADLGDWHMYNNRGGVIWAEDLVYLDHIDNSTETFAERTWTLPAGDYSIVVGSNAPATDPSRQGYRATFTTVPEPGSALMLLAGLATLSVRRRRQP